MLDNMRMVKIGIEVVYFIIINILLVYKYPLSLFIREILGKKEKNKGFVIFLSRGL